MISHDFSIFLPLIIKSLIILIALSLLFIVLKKNFINTSDTTLYIVFLGIGTVMFIKFLIDFFNLYLDTIAISDHEVTLFLRDGFFDNSIEIFDWDKIESVSYKQNSFWDRLLMKGDILIRLDDSIEFPFENVYRPKKVIEKVSFYKNNFIAKKLHEQDDNNNFDQDERFNILVDALSEVVKDYSKQRDG